MRSKLLQYSFDNNLGHIPSALSMLDYVDVLFSQHHVKPTDHIVIGKPWGAQAYYTVWHELGMLPDISQLSVGVKHDEIDFVDYSEETMGNALGVAAGIALASKTRIWVNISDAALQMGNVLEAIQFIGHNKLTNIMVTIDYNGVQVTGNTNDIINVEPCKSFFANCGWFVQEVNGHNRRALDAIFNNLSTTQPNVIFCNTVKGNGITQMEQEPKKWHYKKIETLTELQSLVAELRDI